MGVSVRGAGPRDLASLRRQLGGGIRPLGDRPADIEVTYGADPPAGLRLIGTNDAAADEHSFYVWGDSGDAAPVRLELDERPPFRLYAPKGTARLPILVQLVSAAAAGKGYIPLHASAFRWKGKGVLVAGWSKGGKTEALLAFMGRDATYVGDEWLFMAADRPVVSGIPEPIRVRDWHLHDLPELRGRLTRRQRLRLAATEVAGTATAHLSRQVAAARPLARLMDRQRHTRVDPLRLFGPDRCTDRTAIDVVFLMMSATSTPVRADPVDPSTAARRIAASTLHEHLRLLEVELKRRYGRPDRHTPLWDRLDPTGSDLADRLSDLPTYEVVHPYPVSTPALFWVMAPVIEQS